MVSSVFFIFFCSEPSETSSLGVAGVAATRLFGANGGEFCAVFVDKAFVDNAAKYPFFSWSPVMTLALFPMQWAVGIYLSYLFGGLVRLHVMLCAFQFIDDCRGIHTSG